MIIIPAEIVPKLKEMKFDERNELFPIQGELDGEEVYFLQAELKENPIFEKALADFEVCEIKDIETIETKYYDPKTSIEVKDIANKDIVSMTAKTILTVKK